MPELTYVHIDAFADGPFVGNQAAVIPLDEWLDDETLLAIGEENNFAETAFIVRDGSGETDYQLRWFTPGCEVRLCGHATLASGHYVLSEDEERDKVVFRTRDAGLLTVTRDDDGYALSLPAYPPAPGEFPEAVAALGAEPAEVHRHPDRYNLFLYDSAEDVLGLKPDMRALAALGDGQFIATAPGSDSDVVSRVFVPGAGVDEDSVTGSAHAVLTPFWADRLGTDSFTAFQASARGGYVGCRLDGDRAVLSGKCYTVVKGIFCLP